MSVSVCLLVKVMLHYSAFQPLERRFALFCSTKISFAQPTLAMAYTENFHWGRGHAVAYGGHFYFLSAVCDVIIARHIPVSKPMFWRSLLTQHAYSSTHTLLISCVITLNINYQRIRRKYT